MVRPLAGHTQAEGVDPPGFEGLSHPVPMRPRSGSLSSGAHVLDVHVADVHKSSLLPQGAGLLAQSQGPTRARLIDMELHSTDVGTIFETTLTPKVGLIDSLTHDAIKSSTQ